MNTLHRFFPLLAIAIVTGGSGLTGCKAAPPVVRPSAIAEALPAPPIIRATAGSLTLIPGVNNEAVDEFNGPFPSWANVKRDFGAKGDGKSDDTAAIQAGLDAMSKDSGPYVLYLPAGTYRITATLTMISHFYRSVIGEDPTKTVIEWAGPAGGTMMLRNGVRWGRLSRLTWDGKGVAQTCVRDLWDGKVPNYATYNLQADEIFQNAQFGLRIGQPHNGDAEMEVARCRFRHCSRAGLSVNSFNTLDIWAWDCVFEDCGIGATNQSFSDPAFYASKDPKKGTDLEGGGGHFHVYDSIFRHSQVADMTVMHSEYFGIYDNVSVGSRAFFLALKHPMWAADETWGVTVMLQRNLVLDPLDKTPVRMQSTGPTTLIDNVFRIADPGNAPTVLSQSPAPGDLNSVGNSYPVATPIMGNGRVYTLDDHLVSAASISNPNMKEPVSEPAVSRPVFEVSASPNAGPETAAATTAAVQKAIDAAAAQNGRRPIVHFPAGSYCLNASLIVPAGTDVQLVGDSGQSLLKWTGTTSGPMVWLKGPSHATLREMQLWGAPAPGNAAVADALRIDNADQVGARVFSSQLGSNGDIGILTDHLDNTDVSLRSGGYGGGEGLHVIGGEKQAAGQETAGRVCVFGAATADDTKGTYHLENNGSLLVRDAWYEGGGELKLIDFDANSRGTFTLEGAQVAVEIKGGLTNPAIDIHDFDGRASFIGVGMAADNRFGVEGSSAKTNALFLGDGGNLKPLLTVNSSAAKVALIGSRQSKPTPDGTVPVANQGTPSAEWVREMLRQTRSSRPRPLTPLPTGVTDVRLFRVIIFYAKTGVAITH